MSKHYQWLAGALAVGLFAILTAAPALAETRTKIDQIDLDFNYTAEVGESDMEISVTTSTDGVSISDIEVVNAPEDYWRGGDVPRVKVYLEADGNHYFASKSKSIFNFSGDEATYFSGIIQDDRSLLVLTVKLEEIVSSASDLTPENLEWDDSTGVASWDELAGADHYQIKLYRGNTFMGSTVQTPETTYDFSKKLDRTGKYKFMVRGVDKDKVTGNWAESEVLEVTKDTLPYYTGIDKSWDRVEDAEIYQPSGSQGGPGAAFQGKWEQDSLGWRYRRGDGSYSKDCWEYVNGHWYFFNGASYMQGGWVLSNGKWYYCDWTTGAMLINTKTPDGQWVDMYGVWIQ